MMYYAASRSARPWRRRSWVCSNVITVSDAAIQQTTTARLVVYLLIMAPRSSSIMQVSVSTASGNQVLSVTKSMKIKNIIEQCQRLDVGLAGSILSLYFRNQLLDPERTFGSYYGITEGSFLQLKGKYVKCSSVSTIFHWNAYFCWGFTMLTLLAAGGLTYHYTTGAQSSSDELAHLVPKKASIHQRKYEHLGKLYMRLGPHALWSPSLTREMFFLQKWEQQPALLRSTVLAETISLSKKRLISFMRRMSETEASLHMRVARSGGPIGCGGRGDGRACVTVYKEGGTLILNGAEVIFPRILTLVQQWKLVFGTYAHANLYVTPAGQRGFGYHSDSTDVFVIQLEGRKQWQVCDVVPLHLGMPQHGTVHHFFPGEDNSKGTAGEELSPNLRRLLSSCRPHLLKKGDVLYLPAGTVHSAAATQEESSLHLTLGVARVHHQFAWAGVMQRLLESRGGQEATAALSWLQAVAAGTSAAEATATAETVGGKEGIVSSWPGLHMLPRAFRSLQMKQGSGSDGKCQERSDGFGSAPLLATDFENSCSGVEGGHVPRPSPRQWIWNGLIMSLDGKKDIPWSLLLPVLHSEWKETVRPILFEAAKTPQTRKAGRGNGSKAKRHFAVLNSVMEDVFSYGRSMHTSSKNNAAGSLQLPPSVHPLLASVVSSIHDLMHRSMPPLQVRKFVCYCLIANGQTECLSFSLCGGLFCIKSDHFASSHFFRAPRLGQGTSKQHVLYKGRLRGAAPAMLHLTHSSGALLTFGSCLAVRM